MSDKNKALATYGTGQAYYNDHRLFNMTELMITNTPENVEIPLQNSVTNLPVGQSFTARAVTSDFNIALLATLTGGTVSTGSTRPVKETLAKVSNALTLSQTPGDVQHITITPSGASKQPLIKVSSAPAVGEYSISGTTVTLNASQTETTFVCEYSYADAVNGETVTVDPDDLPAQFEFIGFVRAADLMPGLSGYVCAEFAKCRRTAAFTFGGSKSTHQAIEIEFVVENLVSGDVKFSQYTA